MELFDRFNRKMRMGEVRAKVRLENDFDLGRRERGELAAGDVRAQEIEAIVDTGAVEILLPQELVEALGLTLAGKVIVALADDRRAEMHKAHTLAVTVCGRTMWTSCLVGPPGCEPLLGQLLMEDLDLIVDPRQGTLTPRPESPFLPTLKLKSASPAFSS